MNASTTNTQIPAPDARSAQQIERDLAATRATFGATLGALSDKLDVKTRAKDWSRETAASTQRRAKTLIDERGRELAIAGGALAAAVLALVIARGGKR